MGCGFLDGVEGADDNVKGEPDKHQPPRPIVAEEQKHAPEDCEEPNYRYKDDVVFERPLRKVVREANTTREDEQNAEDSDWPGSLHDGRAEL